MTLPEHALKETCRQLAFDEKMQGDDYIEWTANGFTKVATGSMLVGKPVEALPPITEEGVLTNTKRAAKAYRHHLL